MVLFYLPGPVARQIKWLGLLVAVVVVAGGTYIAQCVAPGTAIPSAEVCLSLTHYVCASLHTGAMGCQDMQEPGVSAPWAANKHNDNICKAQRQRPQQAQFLPQVWEPNEDGL